MGKKTSLPARFGSDSSEYCAHRQLIYFRDFPGFRYILSRSGLYNEVGGVTDLLLVDVPVDESREGQ